MRLISPPLSLDVLIIWRFPYSFSVKCFVGWVNRVVETVMTLHWRNVFLRGISSLASTSNQTIVKSSAQFALKTFPLIPAATSTSPAVRQFTTSPSYWQSDSSDYSAIDLYSSGKNAIRQLSEEALEESLKEDDFFDLKGLVNMQELFDAGVHYGHKKGMGFESMTEYLLGHRFDNCIIDLNHTGDFHVFYSSSSNMLLGIEKETKSRRVLFVWVRDLTEKTVQYVVVQSLQTFSLRYASFSLRGRVEYPWLK